MNVIYRKEPLYKLDALYVATEIFNNKGFYPLDFEKYNISKKDLNNKFADICEYLKNILSDVQKILDKNTQFNAFFDKYGNKKYSISEFAFITYINESKSFSEFTYDDLVKGIVKFIDVTNYIFDLEYKKKIDFSDISSVVECIENSVFNDTQKFLLVKLSMNVNNIIDDIIKMLIDLENIMKKYFYLIENYFKTSFASVENKNLRDTKLWQELKNHNIENMNGNLIFYSSIFLSYNYNVSLLSSMDNDKESDFLVGIGILPYLLDEYKINEEQKNEKIKGVIKILTDDKRLEIINLLSKNEMYGKEIADALGITTATVSHHINNLIQNKIVNTRTEGRKMYFSLNKKTFLEISYYFKKLGGKNGEAE
ncbi:MULTISPECIES: winged helix-turn-helix domain-containing protein [Helcococcus]|uniref:Winged helix-turn-helix domain-containing protein n=1 Tax=Helcococcus bovis TaxID=3153252 RepID=A0ABW9F462_9FIRM